MAAGYFARALAREAHDHRQREGSIEPLQVLTPIAADERTCLYSPGAFLLAIGLCEVLLSQSEDCTRVLD